MSVISLKQMCMFKHAAFQTLSSFIIQHTVLVQSSQHDRTGVGFLHSSDQTLQSLYQHQTQRNPVLKDYLPTGKPKICSGLGRANRNLRVSWLMICREEICLILSPSCQYNKYKFQHMEINRQGKYLFVYQSQLVFFRGINQGNLWFPFPVKVIITQQTCC